MARYLAMVGRRARVRPGDLPGAIGILVDPADPLPVGVAYAVGHVGGHHLGEDRGPIEAVWTLVIDKQPLEGRWALRDGVFIELGEEAL